MQEIKGQAVTVRQLLSAKRFKLDYYQREYKWHTRQVRELVEDLSASFLEDYSPEHHRLEIQRYGHYFLGSIVLSRRDRSTFIIDGQQRLTTLTLLLVYLHTQLGAGGSGALNDLIFSEQYGERSFNIAVEERAQVMEALYEDRPYDDLSATSESIETLLARYSDIVECFPADITQEALPFFADWLIENVHLVEIVAGSDEDAYTIFETMNDRGLSLAPLDMLKGWVLTNVYEAARGHADDRWKQIVSGLRDLGKEEDADAVKSWLRSQYAITIREHSRGAQPGDFDRIGTDFHRWIREQQDAIGLSDSDAFVSLIERDFDFYSRQYRLVRDAAATEKPGLEDIYHNGRLQFTLQYPLLLAPLVPGDSEDLVKTKLRIVAAYIDITLARRLWNSRSIAYNRLVDPIFAAVLKIRGAEPRTVSDVLVARLDEDGESFADNEQMHLDGHNRPRVRYMLARMTDYLGRQAGRPARLGEYLASGKDSHDVEHIWADKFERHSHEFKSEQEFKETRDLLGGLLLLPRSFNRSYGALTYEEKLPKYVQQNLLASSLNAQAYEHDPGFQRYLDDTKMPFRSYDQFDRVALEERQRLYLRLAEQVWDPARLST